MRHFLFAVDGADLVQVVDGGRQATVHAEHLLVNDGRQAEVVKNVGAIAPDIHAAVFTKALVVEAIYLCDLTALVVASDQGYPVWVAHLRNHSLV